MYCVDGVAIAAQCTATYCAPPNLGITRMWICRLNFAQRPIFSGLSFFNEPEILLRCLFFRAWVFLTSLKSQTRDPSLKSLPEDLCSGFLCPEKNPLASAGFEPTTLGSWGEHITLRPTTAKVTKAVNYTSLTDWQMTWWDNVIRIAPFQT